MEFNLYSWVTILGLFTLPVLVIAVLRFIYRRRGGIGTGWGGTLLISLCWLAALLSLVTRIRG